MEQDLGRGFAACLELGGPGRGGVGGWGSVVGGWGGEGCFPTLSGIE